MTPGTGGRPSSGPRGQQETTYFLSANRSKRSITLDLKDEDDRVLFDRMLLWADVLVENFRPGVMERLGLTGENLERINPELIVLTITGFGSSGPDRDRVAYDQILQAEAGLMSVTGTRPMTWCASGYRSPTSRPACSGSSACSPRSTSACEAVADSASRPRCSPARSRSTPSREPATSWPERYRGRRATTTRPSPLRQLPCGRRPDHPRGRQRAHVAPLRRPPGDPGRQSLVREQ